MKTDIVIIGSGPSGLYAGFYAGLRGLNAVIVDELEIAGGQLATLYPEKYIYDIAGIPKIKAQDLVDDLVKQTSRFETTKYLLNNKVEGFVKHENGFTVTTDKHVIECSGVIIAAGNGAFAPRPLGVEGEKELNNINYFITDPNEYKGKKVAIFGGGDSAVDFANMLDGIADEVSIIHRRDEFRAHAHSVEQMREGNINVYTPCTPVSATETSVVINNGEENITIDVDNIICNYGFISNLGNMDTWGIDIVKRKIPVNTHQETNIEGVYAIGDICTYDGRAQLIACGFGEAPIAVNGCFLKVNPGAIIGNLHSSSQIKEK